MNLMVSYNWLREYLPGLKASPEEVAQKLSLHAFSVERWWRTDEGLENIVIGKIVKIEKHPNADKLRVVMVEVGDVPLFATKKGNVPIVCGGTNLFEGQLVAVALPGAKVRWHGEGEQVEMKITEIRGVKSEGMICAANEIGLEALTLHPLPRGEGEGGGKREILDLTWTKAKPGTPLAKALGLDDTVMEIEITTNRPDAMGMIGLAREVGAILGVKFQIPSTKFQTNPKSQIQKSLEVKVEVPKLCPRYMAVVMEGVKVGPSPWWLKRRLIASGVLPINNIVDITNYVLLEWGQPCHAFDAAKLQHTNNTRNGDEQTRTEIVVRMGKKGEKILALDGNTYDLDENILVIADANPSSSAKQHYGAGRPVAIAGIMGGEETGVHADTMRIVYEIANFDPVTVRRGEHQLGLSSDSSARFNKGLPTQLPEFAAARLAELTKQVAGGEVVQVVDRKPSLGLRPSSPLGRGQGEGNKVKVSPQDISRMIGVEIPATQMKKYLTGLGFKVAGSANKWSVTFPYWREIEAGGLADIAEEVARMYGYHNLPSVLPAGAPPDEPPNIQFAQERMIKEILRGAGLTELYTYSFISADEILRAGLKVENAVALQNPLSSEITHMRPWLGISMLLSIKKNEEAGKMLKFFELSSEYHPRMGELPEERQKLIVSCAGREERDGQHFFGLKGIAEHLAYVLGLSDFSFEKIAKSEKTPWASRYHPGRVLLCKAGRDILGVVGELHPSLLKAYGIEQRVAFLEWEAKVLLPLIGSGRVYRAPLSYPPVKRDIAFVAPKTVEYATLVAAIQQIDPLLHKVELFDLYEGKGVPEGSRSVAFHLSYVSPERTLTAQEAERVHEKLVKMLKDKFGAKIRN